MALSFGRRKPRGGHGGRCRHFHVHYHLPRKRAGTFSLLRWLPRPSLLSCVLFPLALFFAVLAFVVSFVWFTLFYFVASFLNKDSDHGHGSFKNAGSFGRGSGDVDNHPREGGGQEGKLQGKGKAVMDHATELLTGDSAGDRKLEIKEVHIDGFSQVSRNTTRISSSGASVDCEVRSTNNDDRVVEKPSIFETGRQGMHANADLEGVQVDGFVDEHNIKLVRRSTSGDSFPSEYSINSVQVHDLPGMNEVIEISSDFVVGSNQNMIVPSNSPSPYSSDTNEEYGEARKELSDCTPYEIINFIDKHETRDEPLDETAGLLTSSDGSAHVIIPGEHTDSTEDKDAGCVPESLIDCVRNPEQFDEQPVPDVPIIEANAKQSADTSDEVHDFSNEDEAAALSQYSVCEDTVSSDDKQAEAIGNNGVEPSDPASAACDIVGNHQTATRALDDSVNGNSTGVAVASRETSEDEAGDDSSSEGAPRGRPLLRWSPSQWWNLCGVVDVFAGSDD